MKVNPVGGSSVHSVPGKWLGALVPDLQQHRGSSLIVAVDHQSPVVHALAHAINEALGNAGKTVVYTAPIEISPVNQMDSLKQLTDDMAAGKVQISGQIIGC